MQVNSKMLSEGEFFQLLSNKDKYTVIFDIETGPGDTGLLEKLFTPPADLPEVGEFDESAVKVGNLKDPAKIAAKIWDEREKHRQAAKDWDANNKAAKAAAWDEFVNEAPKSALYGRVVAVGYGFVDSNQGLSTYIDIAADEQQMLARFWRMIVEVRRQGRNVITHNGHNFDLPFMKRRAFVHGMRVPTLRTKYNKWEDAFLDTMVEWGSGEWKAYVKLDHLAKLFGVQGKLEGVSGADFWKLLRDNKVDLAREYLNSDIVATAAVAQKMFLL